MNGYVGIEISGAVCVVVLTPERGLVARAEYELPFQEPARTEAIPAAVAAALSSLGPKLPPCAAVGIAVSPPDETSLAALVQDDAALATLNYIARCPVTFAQPEIAALFAFAGGGSGKAWCVLGGRSRLYFEGAAFGLALSVSDGRAAAREVAYEPCDQVMEPIGLLRVRFGLFETLSDIENVAGLVKDSAGVRMAPRRVAGQDDGMAVLGLKPGIRRPQLARAALEAVGASIRHAISGLAGEGAVDELFLAGAAARHDMLMSVVADMLGKPLLRAEVRDPVAYGAAMRAAAAAGASIARPERRRFNPSMPAARREELHARWLIAAESSGES